ncbi:AAA family ATPase [Micromonospora sp. MMS20-R1-14]|uniref:AAA family ATPase n=2 Tax=Micromonospora humida TaxID=2809018 RepID=A0ABS2IUZ9_9ACTN|nr:AAA family ATPase [Micromonospora humida]
MGMLRIGPESGSEVWVGRERELSLTQTALTRLARGTGGVVRLVGEPGIGKTSLLTIIAQAAADRGHQVFHAVADQLSHQSPLSVLLACLGVRQRPDDPSRADITQTLLGRPPVFPATGSALAAVADMLVSLVDDLCAAGPTVLIVDDAHWMDEPSTVVWRRLAASAEHLPLLLVAAHRQDPSRPTRTPVSAGRGHEHLLSLTPLDETQVAQLLTGLLGAPPGPTLSRWSGAAVGNPLYLHELAAVLAREDLVQVVAGHADLRDDDERIPPALTAALTSRFGLVPDAGDVLRTAALLGTEFTVTDLSVVLGRPVRALADVVQRAVAARILAGSGQRMTFCHPLIRQALHDAVALPLRRALHLDLARELAAAAAEPLTVAHQLEAAGGVENRWVPDWLQRSAPALTHADPALTVRLLRTQLGQLPADDPHRAALSVALARALQLLGRWEEAADRAREALASSTGLDAHGELHWLLIRALNNSGKTDEAELILRQALTRPAAIPEPWRGRLLGTLALISRAGTGGPDEAETLAGEALDAGRRCGDDCAIAGASVVLSLTRSDRRDHPAALRHAEQALTALVGHPGHPELEMFALHCRVVSLQNMARWREAERVLRLSREIRRRAHDIAAGSIGVTQAMLHYWVGRWDEALTALTPVADDPCGPFYPGLHRGGPALLRRGVTALIAVRRDDRALAETHLHSHPDVPADRSTDEDGEGFLLAARAVRAEQQGEPERGAALLATMLQHRPDTGTGPHHPWFADLIRMASACTDTSTVTATLDLTRLWTEAEKTPGRAATMRQRCMGLATEDPGPLRTAVQHYRSAGPRTELAATLEDLAVVLAGHGATDECRAAATEAIGLYSRMGATWDVRRTEARLRGRGVRRGVSGPRAPRPVSGWAALTATERRVAVLVAEGRSTPEIAATMLLTRRTVQTHISRALHKLGLQSRNQIAREVLRNAGAR